METEVLSQGLMNLWIIGDGICVYSQEFVPSNTDVGLVTSFFSAMLCFSKEVTGQQIKYIQLNDMRIFFYLANTVVFAAATRNEVKLRHIEDFLKRIEERFSAKYSNYIEQELFHMPQKFQDFAIEIEQELGKESTCLSYITDDAEIVQVAPLKAAEYSRIKDILLDNAYHFRDRCTVVNNKEAKTEERVLKDLGRLYAGGQDKQRQ
jgi:hypothetical protein